MLGINTKREPITGDIAKRIRDAVARISTGQLNEHDKEMIERSKRTGSKYTATWVGLNGKSL